MNEIEKECWKCKFCDDLKQHQTMCKPFKEALIEAIDQSSKAPVSIKGNLSDIPELPIDEMWLGKVMEENRRKLKA